MKINEIKNVDKFFEFINKCGGNVWLKSPDGDVIGLKSKLSEVFAVARIFGLKDEWIGRLDIDFEDKVDLSKCLYYIAGGEM